MHLLGNFSYWHLMSRRHVKQMHLDVWIYRVWFYIWSSCLGFAGVGLILIKDIRCLISLRLPWLNQSTCGQWLLHYHQILNFKVSLARGYAPPSSIFLSMNFLRLYQIVNTLVQTIADDLFNILKFLRTFCSHVITLNVSLGSCKK